MKTLAILSLLLLTFSVSAQTKADTAAFWKNLRGLCGKAFEGTVAVDSTQDPRFAGKRLVMHVRSCSANRIKIPFHVGEDRSRTWVLTRLKSGRIQLKHDHRHEDGKPDEVTMYGGTSTNVGAKDRQLFPADDQTVRVVPAAFGNMWWIDLKKDEEFVYNLRRMGTDRLFSVKFDLTKEVEAPPAPWGAKN